MDKLCGRIDPPHSVVVYPIDDSVTLRFLTDRGGGHRRGFILLLKGMCLIFSKLHTIC